MAMDLSYTEGVIAVREKYLLKDRLLRLCEMTTEDAFRSLLEYGFGGGAETASSVYDYEKLIEREERLLDEFIFEYAPSAKEAIYLLSPRDFHNAKALMKAKLLGESGEKMLASEGLIPVSELSKCISSGEYAGLSTNPMLKDACEEAERAISSETPISGSQLGLIFERAMYAHLLKGCKRSPLFKRSIIARLDMTNLLTAFRAPNEEGVAAAFIEGGKLTLQQVLFATGERAQEGEAAKLYPDFLRLCVTAREQRAPLTLAERYRDAFDVERLNENRYELKKNEPFLYYVLCRKAENANVRIIFALQLLGATEQEMKKRLRGV